MDMGSTFTNLLHQMAFFNLEFGNYIMIAVALFFLYLAIKKGFEPLLLVLIAPFSEFLLQAESSMLAALREILTLSG